ncbi:MAG: hemin uptake protein HemP [Steroidobacteraceae bacterium]
MKPEAQTSVTIPQTLDDPRHSVSCISQLRCFHSVALFGKQREVLIEHAGSTYRLRITQANKLILTK